MAGTGVAVGGLQPPSRAGHGLGAGRGPSDAAARHNFDRIAYRPVAADQPSTLEYFMDDYVLHLEHHLRQIRELSSPGSKEDP